MRLEVLKSDNAKLAVIILVAAMIVAIAGRGTLGAMRKYVELSRDLKAIGSLTPVNSPTINAHTFLLKETDLEREIFAALSRTAQTHGVNLKQVQPARIFGNGEVTTISQEAVLEGDFIGILKGLRDIQDLSGIKISSVKFETERINKIEVLVAHIYFQGVKHTEK